MSSSIASINNANTGGNQGVQAFIQTPFASFAQQLDQATQNASQADNSFAMAGTSVDSGAGLGAAFGAAFSADASSSDATAQGTGADATGQTGSNHHHHHGSSNEIDVLLAMLSGTDSGSNAGTGTFASDGSVDGASSGGTPMDSFLNLLGGNSATQGMAAMLDASAPASDSTPIISDFLAGGGPLPAFLAKVDAQLNPAQQQSLQSIVLQFQNADNTPQTVSSIAAALQQSGIPENI